MAETNRYCAGCMEPLQESVSVCPHCFYNTETENNSPALSAGTIVVGRYLIGKVLNLSNDSITYIGRDLFSDSVLSIAEFFPSKILSREKGESNISVKLGYDTMFENCRESFLSLWRGLDMFKSDVCLPDVLDIIESNGTVYAISKYLDSISLKAYFEETKKPLSWARAHSAFKPVLACLQKLHSAGIMHGNISPTTIHVGSDGKLHIMAFSIPQCYSSVEELRTRPLPGFSPIELFSETPSLKPCSDVYSVMALLYYSITGLVPPAATKRAVKDTMVLPAAVASTLSSKVIDCFVKSLSVYPQNRISSIEEVISSLAPISAPKNAVAPVTQPSAPAEEEKEEASEVETDTQGENENESFPSDDTEEPVRKKGKSSGGSLIVLSLTTFFAAVIICTLLFTVLYATVLYKKVDVPFLDSALGSFTFLPMNKETTEVYEPTYDITTTEEQQSTEKSYVTVPDFTNHTRDSIITNETFNKRFEIIFTEDYSDEVPKDSIINQSIAKGESVLSGTEIVVVVSLGAKPVEVPNVIGMQYSEAKLALERRGFTVKKEVMENKGGHNADEVYLTDKVAGLEFPKGTEIVLSVWGKAPETTTKEETTKAKEETTKKKQEATTKATTSKTTTEKSDSEN